MRSAELKESAMKTLFMVNLVNNNHNNNPNTAYSSDLTFQAEELPSQGEADAALHVKDDCHPHVRW